jgi:pSer/pThr/pTyr-binding forkhead associated (FHA) protein
MPRLVVNFPDSHESTFDIEEAQVTVGRSDDNAIQLDHASVSGHHAQFTLEAGGYELRDLGSTNGTRVNGEPITTVRLEGGEQIRFGKIEAFFSSGKEGGGLKPLPSVTQGDAQVSSKSVRPPDFRASSGFERHGKKKDPMATVALLAACLAFGALAFAVFSIIGIQPPA